MSDESNKPTQALIDYLSKAPDLGSPTMQDVYDLLGGSMKYDDKVLSYCKAMIEALQAGQMRAGFAWDDDAHMLSPLSTSDEEQQTFEIMWYSGHQVQFCPDAIKEGTRHCVIRSKVSNPLLCNVLNGERTQQDVALALMHMYPPYRPAITKSDKQRALDLVLGMQREMNDLFTKVLQEMK